MQPIRIAPPSSTEDGRDPIPDRPYGSISSLIPNGERVTAKVGIKDDSLLHLMCTETRTGEQKEMHFRKIVHSQVDWNSPKDISLINAWRNQLYGRGGLKAKTVFLWYKEEVAYLELFFHLLIVEAGYTDLSIPRPKDIAECFNNFFRGKIFDENGEPRAERKHSAFVSKLNRVTAHLRTRLECILIGKSGDIFIPRLDEEMLDVYLELLEHGPANGDEMDMKKVFTWEIGKQLPPKKPYVKFWQETFSGMLLSIPGSVLYNPVYTLEQKSYETNGETLNHHVCGDADESVMKSGQSVTGKHSHAGWDSDMSDAGNTEIIESIEPPETPPPRPPQHCPNPIVGQYNAVEMEVAEALVSLWDTMKEEREAAQILVNMSNGVW